MDSLYNTRYMYLSEYLTLLVNTKDCEVCIKKSKIEGTGVFTMEEIEGGIIINNLDDKSANMNDKNFIYPSNFDYNTLVKTFRQYNKTDKCNIELINNKFNDKTYYISRCGIGKNKELTKRYGIINWTLFLMLDLFAGVKHSNLSRDPTKLIQLNNAKTYIDNTDTALKYSNLLRALKTVYGENKCKLIQKQASLDYIEHFHPWNVTHVEDIKKIMKYYGLENILDAHNMRKLLKSFGLTEKDYIVMQDLTK